MNLLCFDPGKTTGIAVIQGGVWVMGLTVPEEELTDTLFRCLVMIGQPTTVVIESFPNYAAHLPGLSVFFKISQWFQVAGYLVVEVNPGQWKGMTDRVVISGTHQADAATMGMWYYRTRLVNILK